MKELNLSGKEVTITKFGAIQGWKMLHRLIGLAGPALGHAAEDNYERAISSVFEKCKEDDLIKLITDLTVVTLIGGRKPVFNEDFKDYSFTIELCKEVIEYNFSDFFSTVLQGLKGIKGNKAET